MHDWLVTCPRTHTLVPDHMRPIALGFRYFFGVHATAKGMVATSLLAAFTCGVNEHSNTRDVG